MQCLHILFLVEEKANTVCRDIGLLDYRFSLSIENARSNRDIFAVSFYSFT